MSITVVQERLQFYKAMNHLEEEHALREITQEIALAGLARAGFFKVAAFQGGTCLRIFYGLNRFSEDLDFALYQANLEFDFTPYLKSLQTELDAYGYQLEVADRTSKKSAVKIGFIKDDSIGKILTFRHLDNKNLKPIKIKLELDTNPPDGARIEQKYLEFPITMPIAIHDLPSLFAGKNHALLCRTWEKGRDWYDFIWYVARKTPINFAFLQNAIDQIGPWQGKNIHVNKTWYLDRIRERIYTTDWDKQKQDIARFLKERDQDLLNLWSKDFFLGRAQALEQYLT